MVVWYESRTLKRCDFMTVQPGLVKRGLTGCGTVERNVLKLSAHRNGFRGRGHLPFTA